MGTVRRSPERRLSLTLELVAPSLIARFCHKSGVPTIELLFLSSQKTLRALPGLANQQQDRSRWYVLLAINPVVLDRKLSLDYFLVFLKAPRTKLLAAYNCICLQGW